MGKVLRCLGFAVVASAALSCGDVVRNGRAPVLLVLNALTAARGNTPNLLSGTLDSSVITTLTSPPPCTIQSPCPTVFDDIGSAAISLVMKDPSIQPSAVNAVTITRYHVDYMRTDGRNTPGVDVPYGFDGAVTATIVPNATTTIGFEIVRHTAKEESPLVQLINNPGIISTIATVTFYGADQVGNEIAVVGRITINFGNFGNG